MEHRRVSQIGITAINSPRTDHLERRRTAFHHPHLNRRRMRPQNSRRVYIKSVVHRTRRMVRGNIERFEVMIIIFDFGALGHFVTAACEYGRDALYSLRNWVQTALILASPWEGHIDCFCCELRVEALLYDRCFARREGRVDCAFDDINTLASRGSFVGRKLA